MIFHADISRVPQRPHTISSTLKGIIFSGLSVSSCKANVPGRIGISLMKLMAVSIKAEATKRSLSSFVVGDSVDTQQFNEAVSVLKSQPFIPKTSLVETPVMSIEMDFLDDSINGVVRQGKHKGRSLAAINSLDLMDLALSTEDRVTKDFLLTYIPHVNTIDSLRSL